MSRHSNPVATLRFAARTDPGLRRGHNEDHVATDPRRGVALLADGMGGHNCGEVASSLAIEVALNELATRLDNEADEKRDQDADDAPFSRGGLLAREIVAHANTIVHDTASTQPQYEGMGTTLVLALFCDGLLSIAHVGDSRVYRFRGDHLEQLTRDHTLLQELIDQGFYTPEEARRSLNRNVVTQALGIEASVEIDLQEDVALPGDVYLLCSDGLNDMVEDDAIRSTVAKFADDLDGAAERLIEQANANGGYDNISVVLVRVREPFHANSGWLRRLVDWFQ